MTLSRRSLLATCAAGGGLLAGCAAPTGTGTTATGALTVRVSNRTAADRTVTVTVTDPDGTAVEEVADAVVSADVSRSFESDGYAAAAYTIRVRGTDWATSGWWDRRACADYEFATVLEDDDETPSVSAEASCSATE